MQLKVIHIIALIIFAVGFALGWWLRPSGNEIIRPIIQKHFTTMAVDTVYSVDTVRFEQIKYVYLKPKSIRDTIYIDTADRKQLADLVARYDSLQKVLIEKGFERIKKYREVTADGDSVYIELASVKDLIMKVELNLASREVVTRSLNTYFTAKEEKEAWYIKPAVALSGLALGYVIRGNTK